MTYDAIQIAKELEETAQGNGYHGNALRVAKDIPDVTDEERAVLDRWATGRQVVPDTWSLHRLAIKIRSTN